MSSNIGTYAGDYFRTGVTRAGGLASLLIKMTAGGLMGGTFAWLLCQQVGFERLTRDFWFHIAGVVLFPWMITLLLANFAGYLAGRGASESRSQSSNR